MTASEQRLRDRLAGVRPVDQGEGFWQMDFTSLGSACGLFYAADSAAAATAYGQAALHWLAGFEARWSRYLPDSQLALINSRAGKEWTETTRELDVLLDLCQHYHFSTRGAFDPTSLPLSRLWDWRTRHLELPSPTEVAEAMKRVGWDKVDRREGGIRLAVAGMELDLGGVGKEFAVDGVAELAAGFGVERLMVDLGGDIAVRGEAPEGGLWEVGLEDPQDSERTFCAIQLPSGRAVATSGDSRRRFEFGGKSYGHIMDSRSGYPVAHGTRACSVIAGRCTSAGLLSTSAMVLGGREAVALLDRTPGVEGCVWHLGRVYESRGFRQYLSPDAGKAEAEGAPPARGANQPAARRGADEI